MVAEKQIENAVMKAYNNMVLAWRERGSVAYAVFIRERGSITFAVFTWERGSMAYSVFIQERGSIAYAVFIWGKNEYSLCCFHSCVTELIEPTKDPKERGPTQAKDGTGTAMDKKHL